MRSIYVYHVDTEVVHDVMDGILYSVPPGEIFEFSNPFIGRKFMEHKWFHGVVEVELRRTPAGWIFEAEAAHNAAVEALRRADETYYQSYIETQHQDRLAASRPALPPSARQKKVLERQGVNLEDYGIVPIGAKSNQERMFAQMVELIAALVRGGNVTPAPSYEARRVQQPVHAEDQGAQRTVLVPPATVKPPRNIHAPASAVVEHPDPVHPTTRMYSEGEDPSTDPSSLGPEFAGDVNDPNQVPGPTISGAAKPLDLNESGVADLLNLEETRAKIQVPTTTGKSHGKTKVNI